MNNKMIRAAEILPSEKPVTHTPGPWRVEFSERQDDMSGVFADLDGAPWRIAYVLRDSNKHQQLVDDANARLIAAAPELLVVVKAFRALEQPDRGLLDINANDLLSAYQLADAAIAKAEGRS